MLTPRLRDRLSRLARGLAAEPTAEAGATEPPELDVPAAGAAMRRAAPARPWFLHYDPGEIGAPIASADGCCFTVEPDLVTLLDDHPARVNAWLRMATPTWGAPEARLYVDIETAGLSAAPLFLVGTLALEDRRLRLRQFLARSYAEESPMLQHFFPWTAPFERLITFNGQTFDLPYLLDRAIYHGLTLGLAQEHTDLLPLARRRWRGQTPDCRLATLETHLCGRDRVGDVAGADIPPLYHQFVRSPNWDVIAPILQHNALDLLTMAELAARLEDEAR